MNADEADLIRTYISKMMAQTMELSAETSRIDKEGRFYAIVTLYTILVVGLASFATIIIAVLKVL